MSGQPSGAIAAQLAYQLSPIILTNGVATVLGGMLPLIAITEAANFVNGILSGADIDLNNCFANFVMMPGGSLIAQRLGEYPFANQATAANAVISDPLKVMLKMYTPPRGDGAYIIKLATFTALKALLDLHNSSGGTYTVATPAYYYTNLILLGLDDVSPDPKKPQSEWIWTFRKPLLTQNDAANALSTMMSKISGGLTTDGSTSGANASSSPQSLTSPSVVPSASTSGGASVAGAGTAL